MIVEVFFSLKDSVIWSSFVGFVLLQESPGRSSLGCCSCCCPFSLCFVAVHLCEQRHARVVANTLQNSDLIGWETVYSDYADLTCLCFWCLTKGVSLIGPKKIPGCFQQCQLRFGKMLRMLSNVSGEFFYGNCSPCCFLHFPITIDVMSVLMVYSRYHCIPGSLSNHLVVWEIYCSAT